MDFPSYNLLNQFGACIGFCLNSKHIFIGLDLGPAHTTPVGDGPHGPSLGPPPTHTVPLGMNLARPVFFKSAPLGTSRSCLDLPPVGVETLEE